MALASPLEDVIDALEPVVEGEEGVELSRGGAAHGGLDAEAHRVELAGHDPGAGRGPGGALVIHLVEQLRAVRQEGDDLLLDAALDGVELETVKVREHLQVEEAIAEGRRHIKDAGPVLLAVARGPEEPAVGHPVAAHAPVQDELLGDALHRRRRHVQLVQEEHAAALSRQEFRGVPAGHAVLRHREPPQVRGGELAEAHVDEVEAVVRRCLGHHARLPDARRAPDHHARQQLPVDQPREVGAELRRGHASSAAPSSARTRSHQGPPSSGCTMRA
jgi:hypothetical protein